MISILLQSDIEILVSRDPLCEVSEQDKQLVWQYRNYCRDQVPESLPRLVASVKWSSREQTAVVSGENLR